MKVTVEQIASKIKSETYIVLSDGRSTICTLEMENGYTIHGYSACVDPTEFDINIGRRYAYEDAFRRIWPLEGYLLAQRIHDSLKQDPVQGWLIQKDEDKIVAKRKPRLNRKAKNKVAEGDAPYGFKKDGTPKKAPGRPRKQ